MNYKSWLKYFFIIILILVIVFWGSHVFDVFISNAKKNFDTNIYLQNIIMIIFYGGIGMVLGLEHLIQEIKKEGTWVINLPKLTFIGIPSLYFSFALCIYYSNNQFVHNIIAYPIGILITNSTTFLSVFQLILGYSIITSFYKSIDK